VADRAFRDRLAEAGLQYTSRYYRWPSIIDRYAGFLDSVVERGPRPTIRTGRLPLPAPGPEYVREG